MMNTEARDEKVEKHYEPYMQFNESILEVMPTQQLHQPLKLYKTLAMALKQAKKRVDNYIVGFVVREVIFDSMGHLVSDEVVHKYKKRKTQSRITKIKVIQDSEVDRQN